MSRLLELDLAEGGSILLEVDEPAGPLTRGGAQGDMIAKAGETLEQVLGQLGPVLRGFVTQIRATAEWPDEVQIEFAVKLSADANVIIARSGAEANFRIALKWSRDTQR